MGITEKYPAYCLDQAVGFFGNQVEADLESIEGKTSKDVTMKRNSRLAKLLGDPVEKQFASFAGFGGKPK